MLNARLATAALLGFCLVTTHAQPAGTNAPARRMMGPVYSPDIQSDAKVIFRIRAQKATEVKLSGEWPGGDVALTRGEEGIWSGTVGPLAPEIYGYAFNVDGLRIA